MTIGRGKIKMTLVREEGCNGTRRIGSHDGDSGKECWYNYSKRNDCYIDSKGHYDGGEEETAMRGEGRDTAKTTTAMIKDDVGSAMTAVINVCYDGSNKGGCRVCNDRSGKEGHRVCDDGSDKEGRRVCDDGSGKGGCRV